MKLTGITFLSTYNCNASCSHCFFETKGASKYMNTDIIHKVFEDSSITKHMTWVHVSGGEILINQPKCFEILETIHSYFKKNIGISTNAFWAKNKKITYNTIQKLISYGVTGIAVSADYFHSPYIPIINAKRAVQAIVENGIRTHCYIMGARCNADIVNSTEINNICQHIAEHVQNKTNMPLAPTQIRSIGFGSNINIPKKTKIPNGMCSELSECLGKRGPMNPSMVWVDCYGNVMICYGIIIGNVFKTDFSTIISEYTPKQNKIISILAKQGPKGLYELAQTLKIQTPHEFYDECDVCFSCRKALQKHFEELGPPECYPTGFNNNTIL